MMLQENCECPVCASGHLAKKTIVEEFAYKGKVLTVPDYDILVCPACEEQFVCPATMKKTEKTVRDFQRRVDGLLTSDEIRRGRETLGFRQQAFAELLGIGVKNFCRYENGKVTQSRSMDHLLRIIFEYPFTLEVISGHMIISDFVEPVLYRTKASDRDVVYDFTAMTALRVHHGAI